MLALARQNNTAERDRVGDLLEFARRITLPSATRISRMHLHILGICGTFMGGIAAIAREAGHA